ncbi:hypothetical protein BV22DRAFT_1135564, partial [Leucogyrophana mollusca]
MEPTQHEASPETAATPSVNPVIKAESSPTSFSSIIEHSSQPRQHSSAFDRCNFCGASGHFLRSCPNIDQYVSSGKCIRGAEGRLLLPSGSFIPRNIPGRYLKDRFDECHRRQLKSQPVTQTVPRVAPTFARAVDSQQRATTAERIASIESELAMLRQVGQTYAESPSRRTVCFQSASPNPRPPQVPRPHSAAFESYPSASTSFSSFMLNTSPVLLSQTESPVALSSPERKSSASTQSAAASIPRSTQASAGVPASCVSPGGVPYPSFRVQEPSLAHIGSHLNTSPIESPVTFQSPPFASLVLDSSVPTKSSLAFSSNTSHTRVNATTNVQRQPSSDTSEKCSRETIPSRGEEKSGARDGVGVESESVEAGLGGFTHNGTPSQSIHSARHVQAKYLASTASPARVSSLPASHSRPSVARRTPVNPRVYNSGEQRAFSPVPAPGAPAVSNTLTRPSSGSSSDVVQERSRTVFPKQGDDVAQRETPEACAQPLSPTYVSPARVSSVFDSAPPPANSQQLPSVCSAQPDSPTRPSIPRSRVVDPRVRDGVEKRAFSPPSTSDTRAADNTTTRTSSEASNDVAQERSRRVVLEPGDSAARREFPEASVQPISPVHTSPERASSVFYPTPPPAKSQRPFSVPLVSQPRSPFLQRHPAVPRVYSSVEQSALGPAPPSLPPSTPPAFVSATANASSEASTDATQERSREARFELGFSAARRGAVESVSGESEGVGRVIHHGTPSLQVTSQPQILEASAPPPPPAPRVPDFLERPLSVNDSLFTPTASPAREPRVYDSSPRALRIPESPSTPNTSYSPCARSSGVQLAPASIPSVSHRSLTAVASNNPLEAFAFASSAAQSPPCGQLGFSTAVSNCASSDGVPERSRDAERVQRDASETMQVGEEEKVIERERRHKRERDGSSGSVGDNAVRVPDCAPSPSTSERFVAPSIASQKSPTAPEKRVPPFLPIKFNLSASGVNS